MSNIPGSHDNEYMHHEDGTHRGSAPTANGHDVERYDAAARRHFAAHRAAGHFAYGEGTCVVGVKAYTEAHHTVYADVSDAAPIEIASGSQRFIVPHRILVNYWWRTQLGHTGWTIGNIEINGKYLAEAGGESTGSGAAILGTDNAPRWAVSFAEANMPDGFKMFEIVTTG